MRVMLIPSPTRLRRLLAAIVLLTLAAATSAQSPVSVTFGGQTFTNQGLTGVGRLPAALRDSFGETFGSFSALAFDARSWTRTGTSFTGTLYAQPDRGYNVSGTTDYIPRFNILSVTFAPTPGGASTQNQVGLSLSQTIQYKEANGTPLTALDPVSSGPGVRTGFPALPVAYNGKISLDAEGIVHLPDGSLYVSDEYGPYLYRFSSTGTLLAAIRPPEAFIPKRNGGDSFASNNPGAGQPAPDPVDPVTGRQNNQGLEGLSLTPDGRYLTVLLQSATRQDGGTGGSSLTRNNTRLLIYDLSTSLNTPTLVGEHVLQLPSHPQGSGTRIAAQSEMLALNNRQFLVLARDGNGLGTATPTSNYRQILLYDISPATNIAGTAFDTAGTAVSPGGVLAASITPATRVELINLNDAAQLAKFGLHNGPTNDANNLSEKWEGLALVPALDSAAPNDAYLFVGNDNDFLTTNGLQVGATYNAGVENDSMILVYRLTLPTYVDPVAYRSMADTGAPLYQSLRLNLNRSTRQAGSDFGGHLAGLRLSHQVPPGWSAFAGGDWQAAEHDALAGFAGDDADGWSAHGGLQYGLGPITAGLAAAKTSARADILGGVGHFETKGRGWGGFLSISQPRYYAELSAFTHDFDLDTTRQTGAYQLVAAGQSEGTGRTLRALAGWRGTFSNMQWSVEAGREQVTTSVIPFRETGAIHASLDVPTQEVRSSVWHCALQVAREIKAGSLTFTPYLRTRFEHEQDDQTTPLVLALAGRANVAGGTYSVAAVSPDANIVRGTVGVTAVLAQGLWLHAGFERTFSDTRGDASATSMALRYSF